MINTKCCVLYNNYLEMQRFKEAIIHFFPKIVMYDYSFIHNIKDLTCLITTSEIDSQKQPIFIRFFLKYWKYSFKYPMKIPEPMIIITCRLGYLSTIEITIHTEGLEYLWQHYSIDMHEKLQKLQKLFCNFSNKNPEIPIMQMHIYDYIKALDAIKRIQFLPIRYFTYLIERFKEGLC